MPLVCIYIDETVVIIDVPVQLFTTVATFIVAH